jgi:hypothetical protein
MVVVALPVAWFGLVSAMYRASREARMSPLGRVHRTRPVDSWTTQNWTVIPMPLDWTAIARSFSIEQAATPAEVCS